jgi:electron transfer flavoprotein alpha subunit
MLKDIWVFAEHNNRHIESVTWEMLTEGRKLANHLNGEICACFIGNQVEEHFNFLSRYGARKVYLVENEGLRDYSSDGYTHILKALIERHRPMLILIGATAIGGELAARIAAKLRLLCITEVKKMDFNGKNISVTKSGFNDKLSLNFDFSPQSTAVVTVLPGEMDSDETEEPRELELIREDIQVPLNLIRTRNMDFIKGDPKELDLEDAQLILAAGRGIGRKGFAIIEKVADMLGASVGGTRPLVDEQIIPLRRQIGITGKSVSPKVLITCGISGAREFTEGIEKAKLTIAINIDSKARIFKATDMGILGDANKIIPAIIEELKNREESNK